MTVARTEEKIVVSGSCGVEEAEALLRLLLADPGAVVDLSAAVTMHTALWQVLMARKPQISGKPTDPFATKWLLERISPSG